MKYQMTIKNDERSALLEFVRKNGDTDEIHVGHVGDGMLGDRVLSVLYDFHQVNDEFGDDDQMEVVHDGQVLGTFMVLEKIHIVPADDATKLAVQGLTAERPFRVAYDGIDGHSSESFESLAAATKYVKDRWQGVDYMDSKTRFHNDYGSFTLFGFKLTDIGTLTGTTLEDRNFQFK